MTIPAVRVWLSVATSVLVLVQALPPPWALTYTRSRGPCTLNPRGDAAAGPCTTLKEVHVYVVPGAFHWAVHPKPAGPRSCGAAHNPKINTFVRGPGGVVHPKPEGPRSCGATHNPKRNPFVRSPGGRPASSPSPCPGPRSRGLGPGSGAPFAPGPGGLGPGPQGPGSAVRATGPRPLALDAVPRT